MQRNRAACSVNNRQNGSVNYLLRHWIQLWPYQIYLSFLVVNKISLFPFPLHDPLLVCADCMIVAFPIRPLSSSLYDKSWRTPSETGRAKFTRNISSSRGYLSASTGTKTPFPMPDRLAGQQPFSTWSALPYPMATGKNFLENGRSGGRRRRKGPKKNCFYKSSQLCRLRSSGSGAWSRSSFSAWSGFSKGKQVSLTKKWLGFCGRRAQDFFQQSNAAVAIRSLFHIY